MRWYTVLESWGKREGREFESRGLQTHEFFFSLPSNVFFLSFSFPHEANKCFPFIIIYYYTTSSASGQDEPNLALWLATRAGKIAPSCPLGIRVMFRKKPLSCDGVLSRIINPLLTKLVRSKWLDIGLVLFLRVYVPRLRLGPWTRKKKNLASYLDLTLGQ